jgi:hypothetical protein
MRRLIITFAILASSSSVMAEPRNGIGLGVGVATGPNLQLATSHVTQLDVGLGMSWDDRLRVQADHAWRLVDLSDGHRVRLPVYLGIGGFVSDRRSDHTDAGFRMPLGLQADFAAAPIQIFGEVSPELAVVSVSNGTMDPTPYPFVLTGLAGVRAAF